MPHPQHSRPARCLGWSVVCALLWCAAPRAYAEEDGASARKDADAQPPHLLLRRRADEALARGRFAEAATLLRSAFTHTHDPQDLRREVLAWLRADRCERAEQVALLYHTQEQATRTGRYSADRVLVECGFRRVERALHAQDPERALSLLSRIMLRLDTPQESQRFDALSHAALRARREAQQAAASLHTASPQADANPAGERAGKKALHPLDRAGETIGGVAAVLTAAVTVVNVVAAQTDDPVVEEVMTDARVQLRYGDVRRRASSKHWIIPTITTLWSLVGVRGLVLSEDGQGLLHELEGWRLPLRLPPLPMNIDEARIVPQWRSGGVGARLRFRF